MYEVSALFMHSLNAGFSAHRADISGGRSSERGFAVLLSIYEKLAGKDIDRTN